MSRAKPPPIQLSDEEPFGAGVRRLAREQLDAALVTVRDGEEDPEEAIHDLRKRCKEIRALLRLVRHELGEEIYRSENRFFRDLARRYSERRDRWVHAETVALLEAPEGIAKRTWNEKRRALQQHLRDYHLEVTAPGRPAGFDEIEHSLREAGERIDHWPLADRGNAFPAESLRRLYARGRREWRDALAHPDPHTLHLWRKRAKYLWHHLVFLERIWPTFLATWAAEQHELSRQLGEDHDLAILGDFLREHPEPAGDDGDRERILRQIERQRGRLQKRAFPLGRKLFGESPEAFVARLGEIWEAWREEGGGR